MMKRLAYVVFPVSILFIKYYPNMGRTFDPFIGQPSNTGIALDKNMLGSVCMILGAFLFWHLLQVLKRPPDKERKWELICVALVMAAGFWVLYLAHSATSLVSMLIAMGIIWVVGLQAIRKDQLTTYLVVSVVLIVAAQYVFNIYDNVLDLLGKDKTLTDRTRVWAEVRTIDINPIIGTGFESFWLGDRREHMWSIFWWHPIQAHNGYLETYLNIGYIGLGFMIMLIVSTYQKANFLLRQGVEFARFRMGYIAAFVLYNCTEAAFKALHPVFFIFFLVAMDYPAPKVENPEPIVET
jgi:O-antigen ligase